ncbi:MAG: threonine--tRNA ligase [Nitrospirae bacterium]|nr:threonine--tRNA ligase [Nitrospirota bacterium]MBF0534290.1 threonine--tRNA ligase [Nitrospirota bacterium]MBF0615729.1 threonine--tRNA ligase [Nitrospirota bacterium]
MKLITEDGQSELSTEEILKRAKKSKTLAYRVGSALIDVNEIKNMDDTSELIPVTVESAEGLKLNRHSASHIMAHAVKELFPDVKITIGPATEEGFYYDFDTERPITEDDLVKIEKKMSELIRRNSPFVRKVMKKAEAVEFFKGLGEHYKVEIIEALEADEVSLYEEGGFTDLCLGPHVPSTGFITAFKLLKTAGAYWRGDEKNKMLQRLYGTSFANVEELKNYLNFLEEVKKRDHRRLGKELDLFSINEEIGSGLILWHPNGAIIRKTIEDFWKDEHIKADYKLLYTPHIARINLWEKSGHLDFYRENMYTPMDIDGVDFELKPMNCPFHVAIYKSSLRSYRDLPIRYAELGTVYRYERSGVLHGLMRVRGFTQDDAHIFCTTEQIEDEILTILNFTIFVLNTFGFKDYDVYLSTRPEKYVGTLEHWEISTNALRKALETMGLKYEIDPGEGVFYGPKIDIKVKDSLNRQWQCSTIQVDFNNPERFDISYRGADDKEHMPIMIHRALMGSLERFFGVLIEHYAGAFPVWLSPVQVSVLTISERHAPFADEMSSYLKSQGIRVEKDTANEKINYKVRQSTVKKIPYAVIIGDKEAESGALSVRKRNGDNISFQSKEDFLSFLLKEIKGKT